MNKLNLSKVAKSIQKSMKKHSPEILMGIGIAGMITTTVMAVKATPKALRLIEQAEVEKSKALGQGCEGLDGTLTPIEIIKTTWICYIPAAVTGVMSVVCLIGVSSINARRNAALVTAYTLSESALKEYQEKVVEFIGEKKEQKVRDEIAKDKINNDPVTSREVIITEKGNMLCYDVTSGRYFKSDINNLKKAENELNRQMMDEMYISLNDYYYEIGLSNTSVGDDIGWNIDDGLVSLQFSPQLADNGEPCLVINYSIAPRYDFYH